jgi:uncharacterized membrane protein
VGKASKRKIVQHVPAALAHRQKLDQGTLLTLAFGAIGIIVAVFPLTFIWRCVMVIVLCWIATYVSLHAEWTFLSSQRRRTIFAVLLPIVTLLVAWHSLADSYQEEHRPKPFAFVAPAVLLNPSSPDATEDFSVILRGKDPLYHAELTFQDMNRLEAFKRDPRRLDLITSDLFRTMYPELDPDVETGGKDRDQEHFYWKPLVLDNQHYDIQIVHREGIVVEELRLRKIGDKWQYAMHVKDKATKQTLIHCRDPLFPASEQWPATLPVCFMSSFDEPK